MSMQPTPLSIPAAAGIGLRSPHIGEMLSRRPAAGWLEVHAENYMGDGPAVAALERLCETYPLSVHGVGLSLGSATGIDRRHLGRLRAVCDRFQPALVSEHLAWSRAGGAFLNDLLPLRYDDEALAIVARNLDLVQQTLGRRVLVENLSAYVALEGSTMSEAEFLAELVRRTGCGLLLDVNNVHVSSQNLDFDAIDYIEQLPLDAIGEIHLAGHARNETEFGPVLIDDHGSRVPPVVWSLYAHVVERTGARPTLIEWDSALPTLEVLLGEAMWADLLMETVAFQLRQGNRRPSPRPATSWTSCVDNPFAATPVRLPVLTAFQTIRPAALPATRPMRRTNRAAA